MAGHLAILCPGQAGQHAAMFDLVQGDPRAAALLARWDTIAQAGAPLDQILADSRLMFSNRIAQPLVVAAALAMWEALHAMLPRPAIVAGYSIGELAAYAVAGALSSEQAARLAAVRAMLMDACVRKEERQILIAVSGVRTAVLKAMLAQHGFHAAIETADDSVVAGGMQDRLPPLQATILNAGGHLTRLPVEVASHTPLMREAVQPFAAALLDSGLGDPAIPVLAGISGDKVVRRNDAVLTLSRQIAETIRWTDCMDACFEAGVTVALELGPGNALARMMQGRHPTIACRSVADFRSIEGIAAWVQRQCGD